MMGWLWALIMLLLLGNIIFISWINDLEKKIKCLTIRIDFIEVKEYEDGN